MSVYDLRTRLEFSVPFKPRILEADEQAKAVLVCLGPGQEIPAHDEDARAFFYVVEGSGVIVTDEGELPVVAGGLVTVPRGGRRGVRAGDVKLVVLGIAIE